MGFMIGEWAEAWEVLSECVTGGEAPYIPQNGGCRGRMGFKSPKLRGVGGECRDAVHIAVDAIEGEGGEQ